MMVLLIVNLQQLIALVMLNLHSTMFLLIREHNTISGRGPFDFTFHNVSINTEHRISLICITASFTFHNVSINTAAHDVDKMLMTLFTFHNVSINTEIMELRHLDMKDFTFHNVSINTKKQVLN